MWETGISHIVGGNTKQYSLSTVWQFLKKLNINLPSSLAISPLGVHSQEIKVVCLQQELYVNIHSTSIQNSL